MEYVIKELLHPEEDDEANFIYSELDSQRGWSFIHPVCALPTAGIWERTRYWTPRLSRRTCGH